MITINEKIKVIFLDIDGVLNGYNRFTGICYKVFTKLHMIKFVRKHYDLFGVRTSMVRRLAYLVHKTNSKIVLSSSWRFGWYKPYEKDSTRQGELHKKFKKYDIQVIGITPRIGERALEIQQWIKDYGEDKIESFVIFDDEKFNLKEYYNKNLILTSKDGHITGSWYENTGLKYKHIRKAIDILSK